MTFVMSFLPRVARRRPLRRRHITRHLFCVRSAKRPAGMSSILGRIGSKKLKMSTLEKSKMDWDAFKSEEGITEDLAIHNRGRAG